MYKVRHHKGIWLSPLVYVLQMGIKPRLVYDFSWSGLNSKVLQEAPKEAMRFGRALHNLIDCIVEADPQIGPTFFIKVNLVDSYMRICIRLNGIPSIDLMITKERE